MIKLNKFGKLGVRVPASLKRKVRQLCLDMDSAGVTFNGDELTMEAAFNVAMLELLRLSTADQVKVFGRGVPDLMALFLAEMPDEKSPGEAGDDGGRVETYNVNASGKKPKRHA